MLILNGKKFAENEKEFTDSLFSTGETCVGYVKPYKRQAILLDHQKNRIGAITCHRCLLCATKASDGKYWYSFADIKAIGKYEKYSEQCDDIDEALRKFGIKEARD